MKSPKKRPAKSAWLDAGRKILAVGTTAVRALEDSALRAVQSGAGELLVPEGWKPALYHSGI